MNEIWSDVFPRILIAFGLFLTFFLPLLIPVDSTLQLVEPDLTFMKDVWLTAQVVVMLLSLVVYPFTVFVLEEKLNRDYNKCKMCGCAFLSVLIVLFVVIVLTIILYYTMGKADIRVAQLGPPMISGGQPLALYTNDLLTLNMEPQTARINVGFTTGTWTHIYVPLNFITYLISIFTFIGTVLFTLFFGIGLALLPWDLIQTYRFRPRVLGSASLQRFKARFGARADQLIHEIDLMYTQILREGYGGDKYALRRDIEGGRTARVFRGRRQLRNRYERIKRQADELHRVFAAVLEMNDRARANPLRYIWQLVKGVLAAVASGVVVAQLAAIMVYQFNPAVFADAGASPFFLARALVAADGATRVPVLSSIAFAAAGLYFTLAFVKGVTRFGFRFILFIEIHPMRLHATPLNSFLFNVLLMVLGVLPQLQFMVFFFADYTEGSTVQIFFARTVSNLLYLKEFFNYYIVAVIAIFVVATVLIFACPGRFVRENVEALAGMGPDGPNREGVSDYRQLDKKSRREVKIAKHDE